MIRGGRAIATGSRAANARVTVSASAFHRLEGAVLAARRARRARRRQRAGEDEAGEAGRLRGAGLQEEPGGAGVDAPELLRVGGAADAGEVEHHVHVADRGPERSRVRRVGDDHLHPEPREGWRRPADERPHRVAARREGAHERGAEEPAAAGDERAHGADGSTRRRPRQLRRPAICGPAATGR